MSFPLIRALKLRPGRVFLAGGGSQYGKYLLAASERGVFWLEFNRTLRDGAVRKLIDQSNGRVIYNDFPFPQAIEWLGEFFQGGKSPFPAPIDLNTGTDFQRKVWEEVLNIPHGGVSTYSRLAGLIGTPSARAVGTANGKNPLSFIVPCHRVVRADGSMGGYGMGIPMKIGLLEMEGVPLNKNAAGAKVSPDFLMDAVKDGR